MNRDLLSFFQDVRFNKNYRSHLLYRVKVKEMIDSKIKENQEELQKYKQSGQENAEAEVHKGKMFNYHLGAIQALQEIRLVIFGYTTADEQMGMRKRRRRSLI